MVSCSQEVGIFVVVEIDCNRVVNMIDDCIENTTIISPELHLRWQEKTYNDVWHN